MSKKYEFLEHTTDAYIEAYGRSLGEAFENAAEAMFETMTDTSQILPKEETTVIVDGHDELELLYNWLEKLLINFEIEGVIYGSFKIQQIRASPDGLHLQARVFGESFDPSRHPSKVAVKAVTYHLMKITKEKDLVVVRFVLDL